MNEYMFYNNSEETIRKIKLLWPGMQKHVEQNLGGQLRWYHFWGPAIYISGGDYDFRRLNMGKLANYFDSDDFDGLMFYIDCMVPEITFGMSDETLPGAGGGGNQTGVI